MFAYNKRIPYTWNHRVGQPTKPTQASNDPFPVISAELTGIEVKLAENDHIIEVFDQQNQEAQEVVEMADLYRELPHLAFGNRDPHLADMMKETLI